MKDNQPKPRFVYEKISQIGEGSYGKAFLVRCKQNANLYVIKSINIPNYDKKQMNDALVEAKILNCLNHPNIIKFNEVFIAKKPICTLNIVTEYADGGDLAQRITRQKPHPFKEDQIIDWIIQISLALNEIHSKKILHRDIKPANCFLSKSDMIKIGDFGISKALIYTMQMSNTMVGTPYFCSPEILANEPHSYKTDIWSLGILLYELMTFRMAFEGKLIMQVQINIEKNNRTPLPNTYSKQLRVLAIEMLNKDPKNRPSALEILTKDICKKRMAVLVKEVNYDKSLSFSLVQNIKTELAQMKQKENITLNKVYSNSNKNVAQNTPMDYLKAPKPHNRPKLNSINQKDSFPNTKSEVNMIKKANSLQNNNTVEEKSGMHLQKEKVEDTKVNSLSNKSKPFDYKASNSLNTDKHKIANTNNIVIAKPKSFPVLINSKPKDKDKDKDEAKETPTNRYNNEEDDLIVTSPYNPKEKQKLLDSAVYFNSLYSIVNNEPINQEPYAQDLTLDSSRDEERNSNYVVDDVAESLIALEESKNGLIQELGQELFDAAYAIISENIDLKTFNFVGVKKILKKQLRAFGYNEKEVTLIINRFPAIFSIICNEHQM